MELIEVSTQSTMQVTSVIHLAAAVGCRYFLPGPQLPSQPQGITDLKPENQIMLLGDKRNVGVNNLPEITVQ